MNGACFQGTSDRDTTVLHCIIIVGYRFALHLTV